MSASRAAARSVRLLFSTERDIAASWGKLHFGATPPQRVSDCEDPGFRISCAVPRGDGNWDTFGYTYEHDDSRPRMEQRSVWEVHRATTRDGRSFQGVRCVFRSDPGPWEHYLTITHNTRTDELLLVKCRMHPDGFAQWVYRSDGNAWEEVPGNPACRLTGSATSAPAPTLASRHRRSSCLPAVFSSTLRCHRRNGHSPASRPI